MRLSKSDLNKKAPPKRSFLGWRERTALEPYFAIDWKGLYPDPEYALKQLNELMATS